MNSLIFKHYLKRSYRNILDLVLVIGIPLGFIAINAVVGDMELIDGYNIGASITAVFLVLSFQFFGTWLVFQFLFTDIKSKMRLRLGAAPCGVNKFIFSAIAASWIYSVVAGGVVIAVSTVVFNVYWGNPMVFAIVFLLTSLVGSLICILLFFYAKKLSQASAIHYVICFGFMIAGNLMFNLFGVPFVDGILANALTYINPLTIGTHAVLGSGFIGELLPFISEGRAVVDVSILTGFALVLAVIVGIVGRRRTF